MASSSDDLAGQVVDRRFELKRKIAKGGMCAVFEAAHRFTGRQLALKLLLPDHRRDPSVRKRLLREGEALCRVHHPHIVEVVDAGECPEQGPYVALEYLEGRTLEGVLAARGRISLSDTVQVARRIGVALGHMHTMSVIHRDLKPGNVMITRDFYGRESAKLLDLGIAAVEVPAGEKLTLLGEILGTPEYIAPELLLGESSNDPRIDVYGLAVTLFECLAGAVPMPGNYPQVLMQLAQGSDTPSLRALRPDLPLAVCRVIEQALSRKPDDRQDSVLTLIANLSSAAGVVSGRSQLLTSGAARRADAPKLAKADAAPNSNGVSPPPLPQQPPRKRRHERVAYITQLRIVYADGTTLDGRTEDISESGLLMIAERPCRDGERVQVRFALPMDGKIVSVVGVARWIKKGVAKSAVGIEFENLPQDARTSIQQYVTLMTGQLARVSQRPTVRRVA